MFQSRGRSLQGTGMSRSSRFRLSPAMVTIQVMPNRSTSNPKLSPQGLLDRRDNCGAIGELVPVAPHDVLVIRGRAGSPCSSALAADSGRLGNPARSAHMRGPWHGTDGSRHGCTKSAAGRLVTMSLIRATGTPTRNSSTTRTSGIRTSLSAGTDWSVGGVFPKGDGGGAVARSVRVRATTTREAVARGAVGLGHLPAPLNAALNAALTPLPPGAGWSSAGAQPRCGRSRDSVAGPMRSVAVFAWCQCG